ncbi:MAG: sigma-70 family RNA polymerase sigma factor [Pseudomonadales bacterium]|jgi:RNA polymerase sigma-70 factor (ECF subfamily)|nr:sigma-70 family RNA polymerase sigma factor [Pseudomonadales bacterium]MDP6471267.1 sigma-70 family RNA polymerase sigma factor [Pseudomonadales bacterium]MDP6825544.1 sigma-70 family RNA polymerase sigma factor [Pseudomonadales bacterium]MDP6972911.1 sigma-70 family RNA polymerase sigma factor [Pseudomonadales bacterium]
MPESEAAAGTPDEELMLAYVNGSQRAFEVLYGRHKGALYRYFLRQLDEERAGDCFQSVWMRVIRGRDRYRSDAPFQAWLFTIAHNILIDEHRKRMRDPMQLGACVDEYGDESAPALETALDRARLRSRLHGLLKALPVNQREVWILKQETDFSNAQIAALTDTSVEGVKSRLRYANQKLKAGMNRYVSRN